MDLIYAFMNQSFWPFCPKFMKEGGGPDSERDVPIFFPKLGGRVGVKHELIRQDETLDY